MHGYELALVLHLAGVLALFGGMTLVLTGMAGARRSSSIAGIREWAGMAARLSMITPVFGVLAFIPAAYMVSDSKQYRWKDSWIIAAVESLVLIVIILVAIVLRTILRGSGRDLVQEHWPGPQRSLTLILRLAGGG